MVTSCPPARERPAAPLMLLVALVSALGAGCATAGWQATLDRDHPLAGRIWDAGARRFIGEAALVERLGASRFVLLGEKHDNPDHHRLQAWTLRRLIAAGRRPAVAFEMFTVDQAPAIARHLATEPRDAAGLAGAVNWTESGWPGWSLYQPIAQAALDAGLPIVAANLSAATTQALGRRGADALDPAFAARHRLDASPPAGVEAAMTDEIREAHCGHAPQAIVPRMVLVQRARDAQMAERLVEDATPDGAVLITGSGHVRTDRGVPAALRAIRPGASIASVAFMEVRAGVTTADAHARIPGSDRLPFDYVWFTPRMDDDDPCEKFRRSLERLRIR